MYKSLQACRGIAALMVVCYHACGMISMARYFGASWPGNPFAFGGWVGVHFFFVLSGFIMVWIHGRDFGRPQRLGPYLAKRTLRIYPTYWAVFAIVTCAALAVPALRQILPADMWTLIKALLLVPLDPTVVGGTGAPVLTVAWSLQFEVTFYAFIALAIVSPAASLLVALLWAANFTRCLTNVCSFPLSFAADPRILLFALGGLTAWLCRVSASKRKAGRSATVRGLHWLQIERGALALGVSIFLAAVVWQMFGKAVPHGGDMLIAMHGTASALVIFGVVTTEDRGTAYGGAAAWQLLGGASYALYLLHYPLISLVVKSMVWLGLRGVSGALVTSVVAISSAVLASVLFHIRIERPMLHTLGSLRSPSLGTAGNPRT